MKEEDYKLCYVDEQKAWFTSDFEHQWGDDWNDKPYECNAGEPYGSWSELIEENENIMERKYIPHPIDLKTLYFETNDWNERKPCDVGRFSVEEINKGAVAWILTDKFNIQAGTTMKDFINIIKSNNGKIWLEMQAKKWR